MTLAIRDMLADKGIEIRRQTLDLLEARQAAGARLVPAEWGVPGPAKRWLATRLAWWPSGVPAETRVGLVSSRLGRGLDRKGDWFRVLRAACAGISPGRQLLMTVADSAAAIPVQRAAKLFGLRLLLLTVAPDDLPLSSWLESVLRRPVLPTSEIIELMLSPPCQRRIGEIGDVSSAPARDQAAVALSDRLLVASMRPRGNVHRLVLDRLQSSGWPTASVYLAIGPGLVDKKLAEPLMRLGAVGWLVLEGEPSPELGAPRPVSAPAIIDIPSSRPWPYLTHCTRRRDGPWPDQTQDDFLDQLILGHPSADHSALAALSRIVASRKLVATACMIRGPTPVVSFTEVPLAQIPAMRVFRPHLVRWDFEPYAICVCREWLAARGARPVVYGDEGVWRQLEENERPFFQKSSTERGADWSCEREWRHVGDVNLQPLPAGAGLVCVPTRAEAEHVARLSPWPVTVLGS